MTTKKINALHYEILSKLSFENYGEYYDVINLTYGQKLKLFMLIFRSEYGFQINRMGEQKALCEYLQGLPSTYSILFYNYDILNFGVKHGFLKNEDDKKADDFIQNWFMLNAYTILSLCVIYKVKK